MDKQTLEEAGIDYEELLQRFGGNEDIAKRFLKRFFTDETYQIILTAYEEKDAERLLSSAHTLKGVAGNLSMKALYQACDFVVKDLRSDTLNLLPDHMNELKIAYEQLQAGLQNL